MKLPQFSEKEMHVVGVVPENVFMPEQRIYNYPCSMREAGKGLFNKKAVWQLNDLDMKTFSPYINPDSIARAWVNESRSFDPDSEGGGYDMFGVSWEYVPVVAGSMVKPGRPLLEDVNDWREVVCFPNLDSWDWAGSAAANNGSYIGSDDFIQAWIQNGWFERLISFMDFEGALIAMVDSEQKQAAKELFSALSHLYIDLIDHYLEYYDHVDSFLIHDDWGSSLNSFFSPQVAAEMIVPYMRLVTDHLHKKGLFANYHSCGKIENQVPNMIAAGWDAWSPQRINNVPEVYENYGDKIIIAASAEPFPADAGEEQQRAAAKAYAERYCNPDKPTFYSIDGIELLTPAFSEELYRQSRIRYTALAE